MVRRRELSINIIRVELRLYRRSRSCCEIFSAPPHFIYHVRLDWSGDTLPRSALSPRASPQSPRCTGQWEDAQTWWDSLPRSYVVKRQWHEIVRFHEALINELAYDSASGCNRVKARVPALPGKGDLDSWTNTYAATGDACALSRRKKLDPPTCVSPPHLHTDDTKEDLEGLHWIYVDLRLAPYFAQVNAVIAELPTDVLAASVALRRFVLPGSRGAMQKAPCNSNGMPRRFLGPLDPVVAAPEDIARAARVLRRSRPDMLRSLSAPDISKRAQASLSITTTIKNPASSAAAQLLLGSPAQGSGSRLQSKTRL